jgi:D-alanine-D-alanine ligase
VNFNKDKLVVGFTYDLKDDYIALGFSPEDAAEFDTYETINGITNALALLGYNVVKIGNARSLLEKLSKGDRWDLVFNICEGVSGIGREAQVPAILDLYNIPYVFSDVLVLSLTLHKGMTKHVIRDNQIPTASFFIAESISDLENNKLEYPLFVKPLAEGTGKGIGPDSKVFDWEQLVNVVDDRIKRFGQGVLVEEYLPGREFTAGIIGTGKNARVIGIIEVVYNSRETTGVYSYHNKAHYEEFIEYTVPEREIYQRCSEVALKSWITLGCRDGGRVDLRMDKNGVPCFIEVNPLAGLNPVHSDLPILASKAGISYPDLIEMIMKSALQRVNPGKSNSF